MSGRLLSQIGWHCTKPWISMNPFLDGWSAVVHSALPCVILGPFNSSCVLEVAGHVLASSLLEASSLLALLAVTLPRVLVRSLLPLLAVGVFVVLATLPYRSENILPATQFLLAARPLPGALRQACHIRESSANMSDLSSSSVPHARLFSLHPSLVSQNSCLSHGLGAMNSCGSVHGVVMHDNSSGVHVNSWCALGHKNSCNLHAAGVQGRTKALSKSTRLGVGRPAVEKLASPQQASPKLHVEVCAGLLRNQGLRFSQEEEIVPGCAVAVACHS